jgi:Eukaryotic aspartyl protease
MLPLMRQIAGIHRWLQLSTLASSLWALLAFADDVSPKTIVPAPIVVPASNNWSDSTPLTYTKLTLRREGNDGPWSSFTIEIGTPAQSVNVLISTAAYQTWGVDPAGCTSTDPTTCPSSRGGLYNNSVSTTWNPNRSNDSSTIYDLDLESALGFSGKGRYGFDDITLGYPGGGGPTLANQTVASIAAKDFYMGVFGVKPQASNFTSLTDTFPSFMQNLQTQSMIPSLSWAYTAGNQYSKQTTMHFMSKKYAD